MCSLRKGRLLSKQSNNTNYEFFTKIRTETCSYFRIRSEFVVYDMFDHHLATTLKVGGLAVIPTDTIYGIVAKARDPKAVARLYAIRRKTPQKPFIILIASVEDVALFGVKRNAAALRFLKTVWPGKVSVVLSCKNKKFSYLHLGTKTLAFRLPKSKKLISLIKKTGPLVAPSANPEGERPAETISEAKKYFGESVDIYISASEKFSGKPSTLVSLLGDEPKVLRKGAVKVQV